MLEELERWKKVYKENIDELEANEKSMEEVMDYLKSKYVLELEELPVYIDKVYRGVMNNDIYRNRIEEVQNIDIEIYDIPKVEENKPLYENRSEIYEKEEIVIGLEYESGLIFVEGSDYLLDLITYYQGLSKNDLENMYRVYEYIRCREIFEK